MRLRPGGGFFCPPILTLGPRFLTEYAKLLESVTPGSGINNTA